MGESTVRSPCPRRGTTCTRAEVKVPAQVRRRATRRAAMVVIWSVHPAKDRACDAISRRRSLAPAVPLSLSGRWIAGCETTAGADRWRRSTIVTTSPALRSF